MSAAQRGSSSRATSASTAENTSRMPSVVMAAESSTVMPACSAASGSLQNHFEAPLSSLHGLRVLLAGRAARRRQLADLEHRVTGQRGEKLLTSEAGGPNDGYGNA